jgi:hypothetical protein
MAGTLYTSNFMPLLPFFGLPPLEASEHPRRTSRTTDTKVNNKRRKFFSEVPPKENMVFSLFNWRRKRMLVDWYTSFLPILIPAFKNNGAPLDFFRCRARGVAFVAKKDSITDNEIMILELLLPLY